MPARRRPFRPSFPSLAEARMVAGYLSIWRVLAALVREHVLPVVARAPAADTSRADGIDDDLRDALSRVRILFAREVSDGKIRNLCATVAGQVDRHSHLEQSGAGRVVGVDIVKTDRHVKAALPVWTRANAGLIKRTGGIVDETVTQIGDVARKGFAQGRRHERIAEDIADRLGVAKSRATLIARDQTNKLNGQLARSRQEAAGVKRYAWSTSRDERVRQSHAVLEGQVFAWQGDPTPPEGHPGEPIQCRCVPLPIVETPDSDLRPSPPARSAPTPQELLDAAARRRTRAQTAPGQIPLPLRPAAAAVTATAAGVVELRATPAHVAPVIKPVDVDDPTAPSVELSGKLAEDPGEALDQMRQILLFPLSPQEQVTAAAKVKPRRRLTLRR